MDFKKRFKEATLVSSISLIFLFPNNSFPFNPIKSEFRHKYPNGIPDSQKILYREEFSDHPKITDQAINYITDDKIKEEIEHFRFFIIKGAINADYPIQKAYNHFLDPETGLGLPIANLPNLGIINIIPVSALDWAKGDKPESYIQAYKNYNFRLAVINYKAGNKELAYENLGHVLHIIQDLHVIDHVTLNPHPIGGIFEKYVDQNYDYNIEKIPEPKEYTSLDGYILDSASFTLSIYKERFGEKNSILKKAFTGNSSNLANLKLNNSSLEEIADILIPHAIASTADVITYFYNFVNRK